MRKHVDKALHILLKVFSEGAYSNMALNSVDTSDMATKLTYGVLENNVKIEYILSQLIDKKPKNAVYVLLKIGTYALISLTNVPHFAIVSECVEVAKLNGKGGASGFVNAVLKKVAKGNYNIPKEGENNYLSVIYSKPQWFIDKMIEEYGYSYTLQMLSSKNSECEHIRINTRLSSIDEIMDILDKNNIDYSQSNVGGLVLKAQGTVKELFASGKITYQSPSSMLAVKALNPKDNCDILDICSAPGGKAIYMSELCPHSKVVACDLHEHRVSLIQKYKQRMHTPNVKAIKMDATVYNEHFNNKFDYVLVDAPCSCFGTYKKHPDVFLTRDEGASKELSIKQLKILSNASKYLKKGGVMVYSTCTLFREENRDIIDAFLLSNNDFSLEKIDNLSGLDSGKYKDNDGTLQLLPMGDFDGFFIARLIKNG